jgi:hypothetical protein
MTAKTGDWRGWRWKKDVKMPLSWCKTEIDPGAISVIF